MNYNTNIKEFIDATNKILEIAETFKDKVITVGIELQENYNGDPLTDATLYHLSPEELEKYLQDAINQFEKFSSFKGFSIHNYTALVTYLNK